MKKFMKELLAKAAIGYLVEELAASLTQRQWLLISTIIGVQYPCAFQEKTQLLKAILGGYHGNKRE
jgi:hypothetical protein